MRRVVAGITLIMGVWLDLMAHHSIVQNWGIHSRLKSLIHGAAEQPSKMLQRFYFAGFFGACKFRNIHYYQAEASRLAAPHKRSEEVTLILSQGHR